MDLQVYVTVYKHMQIKQIFIFFFPNKGKYYFLTKKNVIELQNFHQLADFLMPIANTNSGCVQSIHTMSPIHLGNLILFYTPIKMASKIESRL